MKYWLKLTCTSEHRFIVMAYHENSSESSLLFEELLYENWFGDVWETNAKFMFPCSRNDSVSGILS